MFSQYQQNHDLKTFLLNTDYSAHFSSLFFSRSSRPDVFCEKSVLQNFTKFAGKHLCQSLFFNKVAGLRPTALLKKRLWHRCFPMDFVKFLRTPILQNTSSRLPLKFQANYHKANQSFV